MTKESEIDLSIDLSRLEDEWERQPRFFREWSDKLADARYDLEMAKLELEMVKGDLSDSMRSNPDSYGLVKATEAAITALIAIQADYKNAAKAVIQGKHAVDIIAGAVTALDQRKHALGKLVDLHGQSYFSKPHTTNTDANEAMDTQRKKRIRKGKS